MRAAIQALKRVPITCDDTAMAEMDSNPRRECSPLGNHTDRGRARSDNLGLCEAGGRGGECGPHPRAGGIGSMASGRRFNVPMRWASCANAPIQCPNDRMANVQMLGALWVTVSSTRCGRPRPTRLYCICNVACCNRALPRFVAPAAADSTSHEPRKRHYSVSTHVSE